MASLDSIKELYNALGMYNIVMNRIVLAEDAPEKISVAIQSFAKITADEIPLLMYDNTATCNGKEGFLLTNKHVYAGNSYETPVAIDLASITPVEAKPKLISSVIIVNDIKIDASGLLKKDLLQVGDFLQKVIPLAMQVEKPKEKPVEVSMEKTVAQKNNATSSNSSSTRYSASAKNTGKKKRLLGAIVNAVKEFDEAYEEIHYEEISKYIFGDAVNENKPLFIKFLKKLDSIVSDTTIAESAEWLGISDEDIEEDFIHNAIKLIKEFDKANWLAKSDKQKSYVLQFYDEVSKKKWLGWILNER